MTDRFSNSDIYEDDSPHSLLRNPKRGGSQNLLPLILAGAGVLILVVLIVVIMRNGEKDPATSPPVAAAAEESQAWKERFDEIGKRLTAVENRTAIDTETAGRIRTLEGQNRKLAEQLESLIPRLDKIDRRMEELAKTAAARVQAPVAASSKSSKPAVKPVARQYYEVKKGDTPYSIARKNGLTVPELQKLNGMDNSSVIHPGDRIIVK